MLFCQLKRHIRSGCCARSAPNGLPAYVHQQQQWRKGGGGIRDENAHLLVPIAGLTWVLLRRPDGGVVAWLRHELGGAVRTPRAVMTGCAATGRFWVTRPGAVEARRAVGAVRGVGGAGKVVVRATRTRLLIRRPDRAVASSCCPRACNAAFVRQRGWECSDRLNVMPETACLTPCFCFQNREQVTGDDTSGVKGSEREIYAACTSDATVKNRF